jgi:antitoxin (DNA-binding transcriptional repressor) of toxin-antitoxin stability system
VAAVRSGDRVSLTVNRMPVADIVPHEQQRSPWVPSATFRAIVDDAAADRDLLSDLADVRGATVDEP